MAKMTPTRDVIDDDDHYTAYTALLQILPLDAKRQRRQPLLGA
jgi:hypothetical protein